MRWSFLILLMVISLGSRAQELKKVKVRDNKNNSCEEYYVLKNNPEIKQGRYTNLKGDYFVEKGYYKNNQKDSLWIFYYPDSRQIQSMGKYKSGLKVGLWEEWTVRDKYSYEYQKGMYRAGEKAGPWQFYDRLGEVSKIYDYSSKTVFYEKPAPEEGGMYTLTAEGWVIKKLDQIPTPITFADEMDFMRELGKNMIYPKGAASGGYEGLVVVSFIINEDGTESEYKIVKSVEQSLDLESIRVLKVISRKWKPGILNGEPVKTKYLMPVRFTIN